MIEGTIGIDSSPAPVSVILIAYNEAEVIEKEVEGFYREVVEKLPGSELIVAEDGSTDGTGEILRELAVRLPIRLVQGRERKGYKQALLDALQLPRHEWVLFSDTGEVLSAKFLEIGEVSRPRRPDHRGEKKPPRPILSPGDHQGI